RDLLTGPEEVDAFKNKEYIKLHKSTMCKVYWFQSMYHKLQSRKIKTARTNFWNRVNEFIEKPGIKLLGFISVIYAIFQLAQAAYVGFPLPQASDIKQSNSTLQSVAPSAMSAARPSSTTEHPNKE
ncbi:MAG: hypothetical protein Q8O58_04420, partial [Gallionella sp.]|nr:hypothetical protein [Gallionella sp.]